MSAEKKTFPLGKGTGKTLGNAKAGPKSTSSAPGNGVHRSSGTGKTLGGVATSKASVPTRVGFPQGSGTGTPMRGVNKTGSASKAPGEGVKQGTGTGKAMHGTSPHKAQPKEDAHKMGKGTGKALRGAEGGHKKMQHGAHAGTDKMATGKKVHASKSTPSTKPAPYGLHDSSAAMQGLRHYAKDASPLGIKTVEDIKKYGKKNHGL